jgi:hypothetical protein
LLEGFIKDNSQLPVSAREFAKIHHPLRLMTEFLRDPSKAFWPTVIGSRRMKFLERDETDLSTKLCIESAFHGLPATDSE